MYRVNIIKDKISFCKYMTQESRYNDHNQWVSTQILCLVTTRTTPWKFISHILSTIITSSFAHLNKCVIADIRSCWSWSIAFVQSKNLSPSGHIALTNPGHIINSSYRCCKFTSQPFKSPPSFKLGNKYFYLSCQRFPFIPGPFS